MVNGCILKMWTNQIKFQLLSHVVLANRIDLWPPRLSNCYKFTIFMCKFFPTNTGKKNMDFMESEKMGDEKIETNEGETKKKYG